jgi:tetratricopeptide (TPR) repeat protein
MSPLHSLALAASLAVVVTAQPGRIDARRWLDACDRGDCASASTEFAAAADVRTLDRLDSDLRRMAGDWVAIGSSSERRRRAFVVGMLALEVTHALVERESWAVSGRPDNHAFQPAALLRARQLIAREHAPPDDLERAWTLAQLATWQAWNARARVTSIDVWITPEPAWAILLGRPQLTQHGTTQGAFGRGGYLAEALTRFPDDPRLRLAVAEGHEAVATRCPWQYCLDEMTPEVLQDLRERAKRRPPPVGSRGHVAEAQRTYEFASANLKAFDNLLPVAAEFAAVADAHPETDAEARVHIGYLAMRAGRPDAALDPLGVAASSSDPHVRYLADYFAGRALEQLGRRDEAIAAYRRALATVPNAPSAASLLAAQLFSSDSVDDRLGAHAVLASANAAGILRDPWDLYWYGDARRWSEYMARLREALRPHEK